MKYEDVKESKNFTFYSNRNLILDVADDNEHERNYWPAYNVLTLKIHKTKGYFGYAITNKGSG